jgi:phosphoribosylcarboxyaminoimidazole (NCAIR) mutase
MGRCNPVWTLLTLHFGWTTAAALINWNVDLLRYVSARTVAVMMGYLSALVAKRVGVGVAVHPLGAHLGGMIASKFCKFVRLVRNSMGKDE